MDGMSAAEGARAGLGETKVAHLSLLYQVGHGSGGVFDWNLRIHAMLEQEVDVIGAEALQRPFHCLRDVLGPAIGVDDLTVGDPEAELGGDTNALAPAMQGPAQQRFV